VLEESAGSGPVFAADLLRGHTETIVLGVLDCGDSYGFEIFKTIRDATGGVYEIKEATLYAAYRRLERDGLAEAYWGDETQGGRRKYYRITDAGRAEYRRNVQAWVITRGIIDALLHLDQQPVPTPRPGAASSTHASGRQSAHG
jgi:DNA-binding PadR family transcriptional regulator